MSVVVISVGFMLQNVIWPPEEVPTEIVAPGAGAPGAESDSLGDTSQTGGNGTSDSGAATTTDFTTTRSLVIPVENDQLKERTTTIETDLLIVTLSSRGGEIVSLKLREQLDDDGPVDMVFKGESEIDPFFVIFGGPNGEPVDAIFDQRIRGDYSISYTREFLAPPGEDGVSHPFTLIKTYNFEPGTYMFELEVTIENSVNDFPNLDVNGFAYTLGYGPQIGPKFESLSARGETRSYYTYVDGKRENNRMNRTGQIVLNTRFGWAGIVGKYFALIGIADDADYTLTFNQPAVDDLPATSFMYLSRPAIRSSKNSDLYRFYAGPRIRSTLGLFNDINDNPYGLADRNLDDAVDSSALLGWLMAILKFFLDLFYRIIPNYGIAILLLTIFVKILLFPITRKSYESTSKMQAINPQVTEIREKFKDNSNRMNQEMVALYKREKVSPLGGCLPILLQMPIFLAMYRVMSSHFALRGAPFFWWISDLSEPETIFNFAPVTLPILGWSDLRLLPILFVATQVLSSKTMQQPGAQSNKNMKMMTTLMPVFFFFILYNVPSGLLLYWITTNVLTSVQQKIISYYRTTHPGDDKGDGKAGPKGSGGRPSGGNKPSGGKSGGRPSGGKPKGGPSGGGKSGGRPSGGGKSGGRPSGGRPGGGKPKGGPSGGGQSGGRPSGGSEPGGKPPGGGKSGGRPSGSRRSGGKPKSRQSGGRQSGGRQAGGRQSGDTKSGRAIASNAKSGAKAVARSPAKKTGLLYAIRTAIRKSNS